MVSEDGKIRIEKKESNSKVQKQQVEFDTGAEKQGAKLVPEPVSEQETETIVNAVPELEVGGNDESEVASDSGSSESEDEQSPSDHSDQWVRRSTRVTKKPDRYTPSVNYILLTENDEPESYSEAVKMKDSLHWSPGIVLRRGATREM
ncbi:unnamed protein product [Cuscuta campestris]|uniref:Uncharacterized protein n=1 Tax=Cuscuta campestris TaxID=132261 RepID=A0A484L1Y2_9ASTE|nr:unnamed protein product [Cuscuta campestris]